MNAAKWLNIGHGRDELHNWLIIKIHARYLQMVQHNSLFQELFEMEHELMWGLKIGFLGFIELCVDLQKFYLIFLFKEL